MRYKETPQLSVTQRATTKKTRDPTVTTKSTSAAESENIKLPPSPPLSLSLSLLPYQYHSDTPVVWIVKVWGVGVREIPWEGTGSEQKAT